MDSTSHEILSDFDYSGEKKIGYKEKGMLLIVFFSLRIFILTNYDILSYGHPILRTSYLMDILSYGHPLL